MKKPSLKSNTGSNKDLFKELSNSNFTLPNRRLSKSIEQIEDYKTESSDNLETSKALNRSLVINDF